MTEDKAKTKWCVHSNAADNGAKCDGSACMAWRWDDVPNPEYDRQRHGFVGGMYPAPLAPSMTIKSETDGHCGLAGRP